MTIERLRGSCFGSSTATNKATQARGNSRKGRAVGNDILVEHTTFALIGPLTLCMVDKWAAAIALSRIHDAPAVSPVRAQFIPDGRRARRPRVPRVGCLAPGQGSERPPIGRRQESYWVRNTEEAAAKWTDIVLFLVENELSSMVAQLTYADPATVTPDGATASTRLDPSEFQPGARHSRGSAKATCCMPMSANSCSRRAAETSGGLRSRGGKAFDAAGTPVSSRRRSKPGWV